MNQSILQELHQRWQQEEEQDRKKMLTFLIICFVTWAALSLCNVVLSMLKIVSHDMSVGIYLGLFLAAVIVISAAGFSFILKNRLPLQAQNGA